VLLPVDALDCVVPDCEVPLDAPACRVDDEPPLAEAVFALLP